jgi:hypothetical protein
MARFAGAAGRVVRAVRTTPWTDKAKAAVASLKAEYEAGRRGDDSPTTPIWPTPQAQLDRVLGLLRVSRRAPAPPEDLDHDADEVTRALGGVDWGEVRAATAERTSDAARAMRAMAQQVDWSKVQPVAAQVSSALIAAVASGRIPIGGRIGPVVARAITDQGGLSRLVGQRLTESATLPPDFRAVIDTTETDEPR